MNSKSTTRVTCGGLLAAAITCVATMAGAAATFTGSSHVAPWVKNAARVGTARADRTVTIAVHMSLRDTAALKKLATEVSSPKSPQYGHYLTVEEFASQFAPAAADVDAVKAMLDQEGMTDVQVGPHGVYVSATATVDQLRIAFHVTQDLYSYKGFTLRANKEEPTIAAALAGKILYIEGLDDTTVMRRPLHRSAILGPLVAPAADGKSDAVPTVTPPPVAANNPPPYCNQEYSAGKLVATLSTPADVYGAAIPWIGCGYTPQQIQAAYGLNRAAKYTGKGVTVAILDAYASPTLLADSNRYAANHGLPKLQLRENFSQIIPHGIYRVSPSDAAAEGCNLYGWWSEQSLDMAAVHGAAPGAHILYIGSRDCGTSLDIALMNTVYNHLADVVTNSYGYGGEAIAPGQQASDDQAYMAGAVQGMTVLFGSGDDGDLAALNGVGSGAWPATSAWVTGVGGTTLELKNSTTGAKAEHGWGTYLAFLTDVTVNSASSVTTSGIAQTTLFGSIFDDFSFYLGSGGGISLLEQQPAYQAGAVPAYLAITLNLGSGYTEPLPLPQRVSPDVAMVADPYTGYLVGQTYTIAGNEYADHGCKPISKTEEYCELPYGGTSLSSPLMAGVIAIMNQQRAATGEPVVGFANPLLYEAGSRGDGVNLSTAALNQVIAPAEPVSLFRGYASNLNKARVVTINSVPFLLTAAPYALRVCGQPVCLGINDVWNYTSLSSASVPPSPAGYNDVTGLGVPWVPKLLKAE